MICLTIWVREPFIWLVLTRLTFFQGLDLRDAAVYEPLTSVGNSYFGNMGFILAPLHRLFHLTDGTNQWMDICEFGA
jgi:hypothetical protein